MNTKQIVTAVISTVLRVAVAAFVIVAVYKAAVMAYDYGYRVFKEEPVAASPGADVTVEITVGSFSTFRTCFPITRISCSRACIP